MAKISDTSYVFREALINRLRGMRPSGRANALKKLEKGFRKPMLYPYAYEKQMEGEIRGMINEFIKTAETIIKRDLPWWIREFNRQDMTSLMIVAQGRSRAQGSRYDGFIDEWASLMWSLNLLQKDKFENEGRAMLGGILSLGNATSAFNEKQWQKITESILGQKFFTDEPWLTPAVEAWGQNNFEIWKGMSQDYIKRINDIVNTGVTSGKGYDSIMKEVQGLGETFSKSRSRLIARDQVGKLNGQITKNRMKDAGIDMYQWETALDERVRGRPGGRYPNARPSHWAMQGVVCSWDDSSVYTKDKGVTWLNRTSSMPYAHPGEEIQCFSGDTIFRSLILANKLYRRGFTHQLTFFITESGETVRCTPNHPILRADGRMIPANSLKIGEDIVCVRDNVGSSLKRDIQNRVPTFQEAFDFFSVIFPMAQGISRDTRDFHNDGIINQKVEVIDFKRKLPFYCKSILAEKSIEELLTKANMCFPQKSGMANTEPMFLALGFPSNSGVTFLSKLHSFLFGKSSHSQKGCLTAISQLDSLLGKYSGDTTPAKRIFLGQRENTLPEIIFVKNLLFRKFFFILWNSIVMNKRDASLLSQVAGESIRVSPEKYGNLPKVFPGVIHRDRIVKIGIGNFSGHVYNLENKYGWYIITEKGLIVKNCRCTSLPYLAGLMEYAKEKFPNLPKKETPATVPAVAPRLPKAAPLAPVVPPAPAAPVVSNTPMTVEQIVNERAKTWEDTHKKDVTSKDKENGEIFDIKGNPIGKISKRTSSSITWNNSIDSMSNGVLTHTHPDLRFQGLLGASLSDQDIGNHIYTGLRMTRAVDKKYRYSIETINTGKKNSTADMFGVDGLGLAYKTVCKRISKRWNSTYAEICDRKMKDVRDPLSVLTNKQKAKITDDYIEWKGSREYIHDVNAEFIKKLNDTYNDSGFSFVYKREPL